MLMAVRSAAATLFVTELMEQKLIQSMSFALSRKFLFYALSLCVPRRDRSKAAAANIKVVLLRSMKTGVRRAVASLYALKKSKLH